MPLTKVLHNKLIHCIFFCLPTVQTSISVSIFIEYSIIIEAITDTRACLKNHSCHLHAPLCVIFAPNSVDVARYAAFIWHKSPTNCDAHLAESIFQTRSRQKRNLLWIKKWNKN